MSLKRIMTIIFIVAIASLCLWQGERVFLSSDLTFQNQMERQLIAVAGNRTERVGDILEKRIEEIKNLSASQEMKNLFESNTQKNDLLVSQNIKKEQDILARQLEIYLKKYPENSWNDFENDASFRKLAVEPVGFSGNTFLIREENKSPIMDNTNISNSEKYFQTDPTYLESKTADGIVIGLVTRWNPNDFETLKEINNNDFAYADRFSQVYDLKNIFLVNSNGNVIYSTQSNLDLGFNINFPSEKDSFLKSAYDKAKEKNNAVIAGPYADTKTDASEMVILFSVPVYDQDNFLGILIFQASMNEIQEIMQENSGLGKTGESYIINNSGLLITPIKYQNETLLAQKIPTVNAKECLEKIQNNYENMDMKVSKFSDYKGEEVIGTYGRLQSSNWCVMSEISTKEVFDLPKKGKEAKDALAIGIVAIIIISVFLVINRIINNGYVVIPKEEYSKYFINLTWKKILFAGLLILAVVMFALYFLSMKK
jgi:hypothetical protein